MDVVFDTEEVKNLSSKCQSELNFSQKVFDSFFKIMEDVNSQALIQGEAKEAFQFILASMKRTFSTNLKTAGQNLDQITKSFLDEIDIADDYMYD